MTLLQEKREFVEYGLERAIGTQEQFWTEESSPPSPAEVSASGFLEEEVRADIVAGD